ncbi:MAG: hypothetical protein IT280_11955 [Ignavibacteria bacterium]|nr:hypothetical protein [Ignavibacteria bacterium]
MKISQMYYFIRYDFNENGFHKNTGKLFTEYVQDCEKDFFEQNKVYTANCFYGNDSVMFLLKSCVFENDNVDYGMDLINGEFNLDVNLEMEKYSQRKTVYALVGALAKDDDPLWLLIDDKMKDGIFVLSYEDDDEDDEIPADTKVPVEPQYISL